MLKRNNSPAFVLTLTLLLSQLPHVKIAAAALVTAERTSSCPTCAAARDTQPTFSQNLATLGRRTQPLPLKPLQRSLFEALRVNFVSTATGGLAFAATDLELDAALPILFQRVCDSGRHDVDTGLGAGWSFVFDDRISLDADSATLSTGTGSRLDFRRDPQSQHFVLREDEPGAHQSFDLTSADTASEEAAGLTRTYRKTGATYRLTRIADANGNTINLTFNPRGNAASITSDAAGRIVALTNSAGKTRRFTYDARDSLVSYTDGRGRRTAFGYDRRGRLCHVAASEGVSLSESSGGAR